jgi:UDP-3-O-[3-hydroxymyristoyl] glucosamine N-acyltransferase
MYSIPVSLSMASTQTIPQTAYAPTNFIFQSPANKFGDASIEQNPIAPATATSSASTGGAAASNTQGSGVGTSSKIGTGTLLVAALAIGAGAVWLMN